MRTVVVGAGGAGAALATRLSHDPDRLVTLIEAGTRKIPAELRDGMRLSGAVPGHPSNWSFPGELTADRETVVARGRVVGGSTAINGGYFVSPTAADTALWRAVGGSAWSPEPLSRALRAIDAMMPSVVPPQDAPVSTALAAAAASLGLRADPVPSNFRDGIRISSADAYLPHASDRLVIRDGTRALRILCAGSRAVGVDTDQGVIPADEIVLCAGGILTPQLLLLSGIGPRADLEPLGIDVIADLPVGTAFADHPNLALSWRTRPDASDADARFPFPTAVRLQAADRDPQLTRRIAEDIEILLAAQPLETLLTGARGTDSLQFMVALQEHTGRGRLSLRSADPLDPPRLEYRYLAGAEDRRRFRVAVRTAADLLRADAFAPVFAGFDDLDETVLRDDAALDAWILDHLGTALHTCATAPMGAVTDGTGRVHGVDGLRIADTSILPAAPHRGPAKSAVLIGELIAAQLLG